MRNVVVDDLDERGVVARAPGDIDGLQREVAAVPPFGPCIVGVASVTSRRHVWLLGSVPMRSSAAAATLGVFVTDESRQRHAEAERGLRRGCRCRRVVRRGRRPEVSVSRYSGRPACRLHGAELGQELGPLVFVGWGLAGDEVEGLLIPADGVVGCERVAGRVAGAADVTEGLVEVGGPGGSDPVVRQLGRASPHPRWSLAVSSASATRWWARARRVGLSSS